MKRLRWIWVLAALVVLPASAQAQSPFNDNAALGAEVVRGRSCSVSAVGPLVDDAPQVDCKYRAGNLEFDIAGVGLPDASVAITKVGIGPYRIFVPRFGCVRVSFWGDKKIAVVYVSFHNGRVYHDWPTCDRIDRRAG
jgi:hypothetical protein